MSALRKPEMLTQSLGDRDDLPGVEGIVIAAAVVAALLVYLLVTG